MTGVRLANPELREPVRRHSEIESPFQQIVEYAPVGMVMIDAAGTITLANAEMERLFQFPRDELLGRPIEILLPQRFRARHPEYRRGFFANPTVRKMGLGMDLFATRRDGTEFPVEIGLTPVSLDGKQYVLGSIVDITERKLAERIVERSEERTRRVLESALDGVISINNSGTVTAWNASAESIFGWTADEAIGSRLADLIIPEDLRPTHRLGMETFRQTGEGVIFNQRFEMEAVRKSGGRCLVELAVVPVEVQGQQWFTAFVRDISARRAAEERLQGAKEELQRKNSEMQQFVYTVSHDLKSPMVTLEGFIGLLREEVLQEHKLEALDCLERIERATEKMSRLIRDLLELSRLGAVRNEPEPIVMGELVKEVCTDLQERIVQAGATVDVAADLPTLVADRVRMAQVFENLLTNALKYACPQPGAKIIVGHTSTSETLIYFVKDQGPGIDPKHHDRVFRPFERLASDHEGTGIGLAIVQRIVQLHGGRVSIESAPGAGTQFNLIFPKPRSRGLQAREQ